MSKTATAAPVSNNGATAFVTAGITYKYLQEINFKDRHAAPVTIAAE